MPAKNINFEQSLDEITQLVSKIEQGNLPLEDSLKYFEKGVKLISSCQQALTKAEQSVRLLDQKTQTLESFDDDSQD